MPYQLGIPDALRSAGLRVATVRGWETRGAVRFTPIGLLVHHTGPFSSIEGMIRLLVNGRADLPGPLCQIGLDPTGVCWVIAAGRGNHAGSGVWNGRTGNTLFAGIEAFHSGAEKAPWPEAQLYAYHKACAALCRLWGFEPEMVAGHKEYAPRRKIDPAGLRMDLFRGAVEHELLKLQGAGGATRIGTIEEDEVALVDVLADPNVEGGVWALLEDGTVRPFRGARDLGQPKGQDYWGPRRAKQFEPNARGGFDVVATSGERYSYPVGS